MQELRYACWRLRRQAGVARTLREL